MSEFDDIVDGEFTDSSAEEIAAIQEAYPSVNEYVTRFDDQSCGLNEWLNQKASDLPPRFHYDEQAEERVGELAKSFARSAHFARRAFKNDQLTVDFLAKIWVKDDNERVAHFLRMDTGTAFIPLNDSVAAEHVGSIIKGSDTNDEFIQSLGSAYLQITGFDVFALIRGLQDCRDSHIRYQTLLMPKGSERSVHFDADGDTLSQLGRQYGSIALGKLLR